MVIFISKLTIALNSNSEKKQRNYISQRQLPCKLNKPVISSNQNTHLKD